MPAQRILVVGGGIAGSIAAFWLAKHDFSLTVIERSKSEQTQGQGLEIEEPATSVVTARGILDKLKAKRTAEEGFELLDEHNQLYGRFEAGGLSPTGALEMMRGDMTEVMYKAADEHKNVTFRFETTIQSLSQTADEVTVELKNCTTNATTTETFDIVIGADGALSRTRTLAFGPPDEINCFHPVGATVAYFSIPKEDQDWPYSRLCHFPNRRVIWMRPSTEQSAVTSVYFIHVAGTDVTANKSNAALHAAHLSRDRQQQKQAMADLFADCGWEAPRVCAAMLKTDNFYYDELAQVKLPTWSQGRVVLVGDSGYGPTPFTGEGSHLAILGAYTLAQELGRHTAELQVAFKAYEDRFRKYVENAQSIPGWGYAPYVIMPQTSWGIWALRNIVYGVTMVAKAASWTGVSRLLVGSTKEQEAHAPYDLQIEGKAAGVKV